MKYSVIIPTYNHCNDLLKPCIESLLTYTRVEDIELIISANGCRDNTKEYFEQLKYYFEKLNLSQNLKLVWNDEPLGYPKATNEGIKASTCEKIILLNNDCVFLPQEKNTWINLLEQPFLNDDKVGATSPLLLPDKHLKIDLLFFFCAMISRKIVNEIGLLDESFSPGNCEDIDYCLRILNSGYTLAQAGSWTNNSNRFDGTVPINHIGNQTFKSLVENNNELLNRNKILIYKKYLKSVLI